MVIRQMLTEVFKKKKGEKKALARDRQSTGTGGLETNKRFQCFDHRTDTHTPASGSCPGQQRMAQTHPLSNAHIRTLFSSN